MLGFLEVLAIAAPLALTLSASNGVISSNVSRVVRWWRNFCQCHCISLSTVQFNSHLWSSDSTRVEMVLLVEYLHRRGPGLRESCTLVPFSFQTKVQIMEHDRQPIVEHNYQPPQAKDLIFAVDFYLPRDSFVVEVTEGAGDDADNFVDALTEGSVRFSADREPQPVGAHPQPPPAPPARGASCHHFKKSYPRRSGNVWKFRVEPLWSGGVLVGLEFWTINVVWSHLDAVQCLTRLSDHIAKIRHPQRLRPILMQYYPATSKTAEDGNSPLHADEPEEKEAEQAELTPLLAI